MSVMPNLRETFFQVVMQLACICPMSWCSQGGFILSCALSFSSGIIACLFDPSVNYLTTFDVKNKKKKTVTECVKSLIFERS